MQPTPVDVTDCAKARSAPSTSVADLGRQRMSAKIKTFQDTDGELVINHGRKSTNCI